MSASVPIDFCVPTVARQCSTVAVRRYVMQDDILLGILTVRETFDVAARLRLPPSVTAEQKAAIVSTIINVRGNP